MEPFPHRYEVSARATAEGDVTLEGHELPALKSAEDCMTDKNTGVHPMEDPHGQLERALMDEYVRTRGYDPETLRLRPEAEVMTLLEAASTYAAGRLAEFESRAHYVHDIHGKD